MPITSAGLPARRHIPMRIGCCLFDSFAVALNRDRSRFHPFAVAYPVAHPCDLGVHGRRNTTTPAAGRPGAQQPAGRGGAPRWAWDTCPDSKPPWGDICSRQA